jgi:glutamyl-tRNA(Gln) amidotransferase subunit E
LSKASPVKQRPKVGLEVHQQLATGHKLFCSCAPLGPSESKYTIERKLRPTHSELGSMDPAAVFESKKYRTIKYEGFQDSSCLVEADEEPPSSVNMQALETALIIALALHSSVEDEFHVMRKIVIDGSNTTGFQRTMLIARGGYLNVGGEKIGVQSVCLEEDAAKIVKNDKDRTSYSLDRLGIPLVEVTLEPISAPGDVVTQVALALGRLLRSTKRVARGIGSIRQDVNISIDNGPVVEIKGVQQLWKLSKVIEYETLRQDAMNVIAGQIRSRSSGSFQKVVSVTRDVTGILKSSESKVIKQILKDKNNRLFALLVQNFAGILGFEPTIGIRLGKQLSELVRFYGLGGIFHSDELPNYGMSVEDVTKIRIDLGMTKNDAFILIGGPTEIMNLVEQELSARLDNARVGVVAETRSVSDDGSTIFMRPRPGSARMYPETDIPYLSVTAPYLKNLNSLVPPSWNEILASLRERYSLNAKLAEQIYDSDYLGLFEEIVSVTRLLPAFVASKLTEDLVNFQRQGLDVNILQDTIIREAFMMLNEGRIAKESLALIFEKIMKKEVSSLEDAISALGLVPLSGDTIRATIDRIILDNHDTVVQKGNAAMGLLMGRCMAVLRGKVDGEKVSKMLASRLNLFLKERIQG